MPDKKSIRKDPSLASEFLQMAEVIREAATTGRMGTDKDFAAFVN